MNFRNGQETTTSKYIFLLSQLSVCLFSKYLLFYYWKIFPLFWHAFWTSTYSEHWSCLSSCHTTIATVSSPFSKNFYTSPFFPCYYHCWILPTHHCIFSNAFPGTVCVLVFQIFLLFPKDYKSINKAADPCFLQISIKMAPYFQQKLYHIDSWIQTCLLSPKTTGSSSSVLSYRQLTSSLVLASDLIAQIPWDNDLKLFITRWKMLLSLQYKYISSSSCSLSAADTKYSSNVKFSPFFPLFQIIFKLLAASKMS